MNSPFHGQSFESKSGHRGWIRSRIGRLPTSVKRIIRYTYKSQDLDLRVLYDLYKHVIWSGSAFSIWSRSTFSIWSVSTFSLWSGSTFSAWSWSVFSVWSGSCNLTRIRIYALKIIQIYDPIIWSQMLRNKKKTSRLSMHLVRELEKGLTIIIEYLGHWVSMESSLSSCRESVPWTISLGPHDKVQLNSRLKLRYPFF